ncbi:uncharacterized protein [Diadema setosum]|uniref:uncharacterized protein n=1 Tax=Diadema setosum TaxID=31175 RepID=UPI003B3BE8E6
MFDELLIRLTPHLQKKDTHFRKAIPPGFNLYVFLRHLATGATYAELGYNFRLGKETIQKFVPDVARAIVDEYAAEVISLPTTNEGWLAVAGDFEARWNLPHCLGALDGKHIRIQKPKNSGSLYFNYKQFFSVVLMALVDSKYQFVWIDVGGVGHQSDAQIYNNSELKECIDAGTLGIPDPAPLLHDDDGYPMPYFCVGDDAFAVRTYMMKR